MKKDNEGFTLVELIVVVSIFAILLGMLIPSVTPLAGFQAQRASNSVTAALDKARIEAMSRLVGEVEFSREEDGLYVTYHLHRGKKAGNNLNDQIVTEQKERIAKRNVIFSYTTTANSQSVELRVGEKLILTYDRSTGGFRPIQDIKAELRGETGSIDVIYKDSVKGYCTSIIISGGSRTRTIELKQSTGKYIVHAN